jgi:hypothetical protein
MTTRIEVSDRAKVVVDHHSTGQTYLSIRIDGAAFGVMLGEADRERLSEALKQPSRASLVPSRRSHRT